MIIHAFFLNDANAGAYAEGIYSEEKKRFFYLSLSNTVGGAVFDSDRLVQGDHFRTGEVGHMTVVLDGKKCYCGKRGCLDAYCSALNLSDSADGKLEKFFDLLEKKRSRGETVMGCLYRLFGCGIKQYPYDPGL